MFNLAVRRAALEEEGIFIGGWSPRYALAPKKVNGKHDSSEDRVQEATVVAPEWTADEEKRLLRKLDLRVLLPACVVYFLAYLDRGNLGNVKILGSGTPNSLEHSLGLKGTDFNWAVSITYFAATAGLLPSNLLMKKISAKLYLPIACFLFGTIVICIAACKTAAGLLIARFFLGIPEAGIVSASIMYFSMWYKPSERAFRIAVFHSFNSLASMCSAFLASGIGQMEGKAGLKSWQWVFIIEGALPIVLAPFIYLALLTFPETTPALNDRERFIAINRLGRGAARKTDVTWSWPAFIRIFSRPSTYFFFIAYIASCTVAHAQAVFLPTILHVFLGFGVTKSNIYTAFTYIFIIPVYWFVGHHSDWTRDRMWHYLVPMVACIAPYCVWLYTSLHPDARGHAISHAALYAMAFFAGLCRPAQPVLLSYRSSTLYGATEQAIGGAASVAGLSIAALIGPQMYPNADAPRFLAGFSGTIGILSVGILAYITIPVWLMLEAGWRKKKTGHAIPIQAMEDEDNSQISASNHARLRDLNETEKNRENGDVDVEKHSNVKHVEK